VVRVTVFAVVAMVCVTLLAALVLVLRYLAAMRVTDGEAAKLADAHAHLVEKLKALEEKLTLLNNRTAR
jgi:uncharacterized protein YlxW (UPF0749 family)